MNIYVWDKELKSLSKWTTSVSEVYVGSNKVRPSVQPITTRWIYWSSQLWLISLSSDWSTWTTIQDKNLWATTVWNNWDTLTDNNCWYFFQWWNNYWFPHSWDVTTSRTTVNAGTYWPWNYYNSSTYIIWNIQSWDTSWNANLWWDTTNTNAARQWPCIAWYHVPTKTEYQGLVSILSALYNYWDTWLTPSDSIPICLKMPRAWYRNHFAWLDSVWSQWAYWTSTSSWTAAPWLTFTSSTYWTGNGRKMCGYCIRWFANTSVQPDTSWTKIV